MTFDLIRCERPLPDGWDPGDQPLLTNALLAEGGDTYTITKSGRLVLERVNPEPVRQDVSLHGEVRFHGIEGDIDSIDARWHVYEARFVDGDLMEIVLIENRPVVGD
jgi:hypothetical protein